MKKTLMLVFCVAFLVLSACSGGKSNSNVSGSGGANSDAEDTPKGPVELSFFIAGSGGNPPQEEDPILRKLNEDLNMKMDFNIVTMEYDQSLTARIAGGTPPDVFSVNNKSLKKFVDQNLVLELGAYLDQMPNIQQAYTDTDLSKGMYKGKLYGLSKRTDVQMYTYWVRKDWLDNLQLAMPRTLDEFRALLVSFTEDDPDGNGQDDTYGLTGTGFSAFTGIFTAHGVADPGNWMIKDNQVVYSTTDPAMKEALAYINELIEAEVVDPEIITNQNARDKAFKGQAGVIYINWPSMATDPVKAMYKEINANAEWVQMETFEGPGGSYQGIWDVGRNPAMIALSRSLEKEPEKLNKVLEFLNYITDPGEGQITVNYGIEGIHYEIVGGEISMLPAISETAYAWQMQLTGRSEMEYLMTKFPGQKAEIEFAMNQPNIEVYTGFVPEPENVVIDHRYEEEELIKFMYGQRPLSEFDAFVETINNQYYLPERLAEAERVLRELGHVE